MNIRLLGSIFAAITALGCGSRDEANEVIVADSRQPLSSLQERVLGFETPLADWAASSGTLSVATPAFSGGAALGVQPNGWTEVVSVPLGGLEGLRENISLRVQLPAAVGWGEVRVILRSPSAGLWWQELGSQSLAGRAPGVYHQLGFSVPSWVATQLQSGAPDLEVRVVLNAPSLGAPYLVDALDVADAQGPGAGSPVTPTSTTELSLTVPAGRSPGNVFISATHRLQVDDRVILSTAGRSDVVANLGDGGTRLQADTQAYGSLTSQSGVFLGSRAHVTGFLTTGGTITRQDGVRIDGGSTSGAAVSGTTTSWTVQWPNIDAGTVFLAPDQQRTLAPGAYGTLDIHSRSDLYLRTGTYFVESFNAEPQAEIHLDAAGGPVVLYVKNGFSYKGAFVYDSGAEGRLFVGHLGANTAFLQAPFVGAMVAPNGTIELQRPTSGQHKGAFFGKDVHVFSDSQVLYIPFDTSFICPLGDTDGDGVFDCTDGCPANAVKTQPGLCGCNVAEVDQDGDGVPSCYDTCDQDPARERAGFCGCSDSPRAAGTACVNEICGFAGTCDGQGACGDPQSCSPEPGTNHCTPRIFGNRIYWICSGAASSWDDARERCEATPGQTLASIDSREEAGFLSALLGDRPSWLGGTRGDDGIWRWLGQMPRPFFDGNTGNRLNRSYLQWGSGMPGVDAASDCLALDPTSASWTNRACTGSLAYVCEKLRTDESPKPPSITCESFDGPGCTQRQPVPCVPASTLFVDKDGNPLDEQGAYDHAKNCNDLCRTGDEPECAVWCVGAMSIPDPTSRCSNFTTADRQRCALEAVDTTRVCANSSECPAGFVCADVYECAACDTMNGEKECTKTGCSSVKRCGRPVARPGQLGGDCARDTGFDVRCDEQEVCTLPDQIVEANPFKESTDLENSYVNPAAVFGTPENTEIGAYPEDPYCIGTGCSTPVQSVNHPWCHYNLAEVLGKRDAGDKQGDPDKRAQAGNGSLIEFNVDPNLDLKFDATPEALGELRLNLVARASFLAQAKFDLGLTSGTVDIVDAVAGVQADRCGASSEVYLKVFGEDLLPMLVDNAEDLNFDTDPDILDRSACEEAMTAFSEKVDRAKKALRDAQELVRQYKELRARGATFKPGAFCDALEDTPYEFPYGDCETETPERTIARFIEYYRRTLFGYWSGDIFVSNGLSGALSGLTREQFRYPVDIDGPGESKNWQIAQAQFFLGPVPMTLQVEAVASYSLGGRVEAAITPGIPTDGNPVDLASIRAEARPQASAGVSLFVGAGFSAGPFELSAGVYGEVTLGEIAVPAHAQTGIRVSATPDERPLPVGQRVIYPPAGPQKYEFELVYDYGAKVVIPKIMKGELGASIRVRFFFFSKRWSATMVKFEGFPLRADDPSTPDRNESLFFEQELFSGQSSTKLAEGRFDWGLVQMPMPFVEVEVPTFDSATPPVTSQEDFSTTRVEELLYDQLCVCIGQGQACGTGVSGECCPGLECQGGACKKPPQIY